MYFQWGLERLWEGGGGKIITYYLQRVRVTSQVGAVGSASCVAKGCAGDCRR